MIYADRLRMRLPGDAKFALGPHVDGGSCERWEPDGYGKGNVYEAIWQGKWEEYDPWESSCRLPVVADKYQGVGACSMFRMFQGWLSMSNTGKCIALSFCELLILTSFRRTIRRHSPCEPASQQSDRILLAATVLLTQEAGPRSHCRDL